MNAGIITQARMTSTRLPGKVMLPAKNFPMLKYHTDRLRWSNMPVYIATTTNKTDDVIVEFAQKENIPFHRGEEENVLNRYYDTAIKFGLDVIVRVTSDCPLIDGKLIAQAQKQYEARSDKFLYLSNGIKRTFPVGMDFEIFSFLLLQDAFLNAKTPYEKEHVTPYIKQNKSGKTIIDHWTYHADASPFRITMDTMEDYLRLKTLIEEYNAAEMENGEIIQLLQNHPKLA